MSDDSPQQACDYCGLPAGGGSFLARGRSRAAKASEASPSGAGPRYCCLGCRLAADITQSRGEAGAANWTLVRLGTALFFSLNVMMFAMALWSQNVYSVAPESMAPWTIALSELLRWMCMLFALPVLLLLGVPMAENAWRSLRSGTASADLLIVVAVVAAYLFSAVSVVRGAGDIYFEVGCMVLVVVTLGRWIEAAGRVKTGAALARLDRLIPDTVRRVQNGKQRTISGGDIQPGDLIRVLPGERIPADGTIRQGTAAVDEQIFTGESQPVTKSIGETVLGGTLNTDGDLRIELSTAPGGGSLKRLIEMVREARRTKGRYQRLADRAAAWFLPAVVSVALVTFAWHASGGAVERGLLTALAVLVVACPCALGLATPMAIWSALGTASAAQVLFKNAEALERLAIIKAVRFDKTGTLTEGDARVVHFAAARHERELVLSRAAALAGASTHPLARAIANFSGVAVDVGKIDDVRTVAGKGVVARLSCSAGGGDKGAGSEHVPLDSSEGFRREVPVPVYSSAATMSVGGAHPTAMAKTMSVGDAHPTSAASGTASGTVLLGSRAFLAGSGLEVPVELENELSAAADAADSITCIGWQGRVRGVFRFNENLRCEAPAAISRLHVQSLDVEVLSGDRAARAADMSRRLGVPVHGELSPEAKLRFVKEAQATLGPTCVVGDGINDAPALAAADVGVALACGTDVSRDSADVCLLGNDLSRLPWSVALSRRTVRVIRQNLAWAFGYNAIAILLAAFGLLNPIIAAVAMAASSLLVVGNSLRLREAVPLTEGTGSEQVDDKSF